MVNILLYYLFFIEPLTSYRYKLFYQCKGLDKGKKPINLRYSYNTLQRE